MKTKWKWKLIFVGFFTQQEHPMVIHAVAWLSLINITGFIFYLYWFSREKMIISSPPPKKKINSPINLWKIPKQNKIIILLSGFDEKNQHIVNHRKINKGFMIDLFIYIRNIQNIATFECNDEYSLHCMPTRKFCCHENYITIHIHI